MTESYRELQARITEIENRKNLASTDEQKLLREISNLNTKYDDAIIEGNPTKSIQLELDDKIKELTEIQRKLKTLAKEPGAITNFIKGNASNSDLALKVHDENLLRIADLQNTYDVKAKQLQELKAGFLKEIETLGEIKRNSEACSYELNQVKKYIPGKETTYFQGVETGIGELHNTGAIYINAAESNKSFKGVI